jgi:Flp pilus assembly protein TadG
MKRFRGEEGATLLEFAFSATILFLFLFGIFAFCMALYSYNFVSDAAREASRYAIVRGSSCTGLSDCKITPAQIQTYIRNLGYPGIDTNNLTASAIWSGTNAPSNAPGNAVTVTVTYNYSVNIPYWPQSGSVLQMTSASKMVISE